jgi:hypothetical protein
VLQFLNNILKQRAIMENESTNPQSTEQEENKTTKQEDQAATSDDPQNNSEQNQDSNKDTDSKEEDQSNEDEIKEFESVKESSGGMYDIEDLTKSVAKVEEKLETAKANATVDTKSFYKNLDKYLSKEEMELRFDDDTQADYYEAVEKAKEKYIKENQAPTKEIETQLEKEMEKLSVAKAIDTTLKKYPDYNHAKLAEFYNEELTKKEQRELDKGSTFENLPEYFEKIYKLYKEKYPVKVTDKKAPDLPDLNNKSSKQTIDDADEIKAKNEDEKYLQSAGFRKL